MLVEHERVKLKCGGFPDSARSHANRRTAARLKVKLVTDSSPRPRKSELNSFARIDRDIACRWRFKVYGREVQDVILCTRCQSVFAHAFVSMYTRSRVALVLDGPAIMLEKVLAGVSQPQVVEDLARDQRLAREGVERAVLQML